jgi:hypothetical protein
MEQKAGEAMIMRKTILLAAILLFSACVSKMFEDGATSAVRTDKRGVEPSGFVSFERGALESRVKLGVFGYWKRARELRRAKYLNKTLYKKEALVKSFIFIFLIFILALQSTNAGDTIFIYGSPKTRSFALWTGQIKENPKENTTGLNKYLLQTDSILFGDFFKEIERMYPTTMLYEACSLKLNTDYIILSEVIKVETFKSFNPFSENILQNTPKNRQKKIKKYKNTKVIYIVSIEKLFHECEQSNLHSCIYQEFIPGCGYRKCNP